ncbi:MAG TPA: hydrogenase formation protein HypD [Bacteroidales bacterium]|nr:hydrogenase formation protein HypD [Bacteroidales bacterium]
MKFVDEYRDAGLVNSIAAEIRRVTTRPWNIMEICGGQTHSIVRYGLDELLPDMITLIHGPGCPVCVTSLELIDRAIAIASLPGVIMTSYGDMLRVPGSSSDLLRAKALGADVRMVYSPLDVLQIARQNPDKQVVFFAVGFETTAPANALIVTEARKRKLTNVSVLSAHVLVPPAIEAILSARDASVNAFLAAGHVCTVMGYSEYEPLAEKFKVPIVVTGFEPADILQGILMAVAELESGSHRVLNQYARAVSREGNQAAQHLIREVYKVVDRKWRGIGTIPSSGLDLNDKYTEFDAAKRFHVNTILAAESEKCLAGKVLQGLIKPSSCPAFGTECSPDHPLGAPMVSSEGACAAYYRFRKSESHV